MVLGGGAGWVELGGAGWDWVGPRHHGGVHLRADLLQHNWFGRFGDDHSPDFTTKPDFAQLGGF